MTEIEQQFLARLRAATSNEEWKQILAEIKQELGTYPLWFYEEVVAHHIVLVGEES